MQSGLLGLVCILWLLALLGLNRAEYRAACLQALGGLCLCAGLAWTLRLPWIDGVERITLAVSGRAVVMWVLGAGLVGLSRVRRLLRWKGLRMRTLLIASAVLVVLVLLAVALMPMQSLDGAKAANGLYELHELLNGRAEDSYGSWRIGCWRHTLEMSAESPRSLLFGYGPDTFWFSLADHLNEEGATLGEHYDNPHNMLLAILVNNGLPALVLYLVLVAAVLLRCLRHPHPDTMSLAAAILAYSVFGLFCFSMCMLAPMFWAVMGMGAAPEKISPSRGEPLCHG